MADETFDVAACLEQVRRRDQIAARELVEHLYPLVIRIVRSHLPRRVAEEDLAQEIFLKMFTRLDQYKGAVAFTHWVSRIAVTTCIDQLRAQKRRPEFRWADLSEQEAEVLDSVLTNESDVAANDALAARTGLQAARPAQTRGPAGPATAGSRAAQRGRDQRDHGMEPVARQGAGLPGKREIEKTI
jgi:RNA polymerase sigma-70 factor (ECF subfamily)